MFVYSMPVLNGACSQRLSYLKTLKSIHMYGNSHQREPDQNLLKTKQRTLVKRYDEEKQKTIGQLRVCLFFNLSISLSFCFAYVLISKQSRKVNVNKVQYHHVSAL